ncbi:hypothetical protein BGZ80_000214, partial [Entomortierella chlamydospora]
MTSKTDFLRRTTVLDLRRIVDTFVKTFNINTAEELLSVLNDTLICEENEEEAIKSRFARWRQEIQRAATATASKNSPVVIATKTTNSSVIKLNLLCVVSDEHASSAFPVEISSDKTVGVLKKAIMEEIRVESDTFRSKDLVLWLIAIPTGDEKLITADSVNSKVLLMGGDKLAKSFKDGAPEDYIHVIVERPKAQNVQVLELNNRISMLLEENENLRGGKSIMVLNVILRPNRSESFSWTTDTETTTIKELERAIYAEYPDREDGDAVLAIAHPGGTPQHETGGIERPSDDAQFRNIILQYRKTNTKTITVALETPTRKYSDFTLKENRAYETFLHLRGISTEALDSDLHKESLKRLIDELDSRIRAIPALDLNEASSSAYVCSFLTQAVLIFNGELTLAPERPLRGRHGHGKVDYSIESLADDGTIHVLGVIEVKQEDLCKGVAQNLVQLESSLTVRKRKRCDENEGEREVGLDEREAELDESFPMKPYGIVSDAVNWYFLECKIDRSGESEDLMRPKFKISKLNDMVNYNKSTWKDDAASVLGQIVWLMRKMHSEIPRRKLQ